MRNIELLLIIGLLFPITIYAQKDYESGYVVTNDNDTLVGFVKDRKQPPFGKLYKKVYFKNKHKKQKYSPNEIIAYKQENYEYESMWIDISSHLINEKYTSISNQGEKIFLKVIEKGYLTYYQREFEYADNDYIDQISLFKREDENSLERVTQGIFGLRKESLGIYFSDCPELVDKITKEDIKTPIEIVRFYNSWRAKKY